MKSGGYEKYVSVTYEDYPSKKTKINSENLNKTDERVKQHDQRICGIESVLADREEVTLLSSAWVKSKTYEGYYEQEVTLVKEHTINAETRIHPEEVIPTEEEQKYFEKLEEMLISDEADKVIYLSKEMPDKDIPVYVIG